jgi:NAD+ diphosphatase
VARSPEGFLCDDNGALFPREWLKRQDLSILAEHGIGHLDGEPVYLLELRSPGDVPGCHWKGLRAFMLEGDHTVYKVLGYAAQIGTWAREHRFCGNCGQPTHQVVRERAMYCEPCDLRYYPRISPSMIVLVTRGDEILLGRSPRFVAGVYSTLAGFAEPGESAEDCLIREVREEVSIEVRNIQYMGSQCWPFPHSMMLGFHAEYAGGEIQCQEDEIEDAQWFNVRALPPLPASRSIARYLIDVYVARRLGHAEPVLPG